jgi:ribonucleoside-diphosphate reductase beta chain
MPLVNHVARAGRIEEEIYLTSFLWEEAKHVEFFRRWFDHVPGVQEDLNQYLGPAYKKIFYEELPTAMSRLREDSSPEAQVRASVTYNVIVEGVLAETGYHSYHLALEQRGLMPGLREGIANIKRDESRHIAYGVHLLSRLVAADPSLWAVAEEEMARLLVPAMQFIDESFADYGPVSPLGVRLDEIAEFAQRQFAKRLDRIRRGAAHEEVEPS